MVAKVARLHYQRASPAGALRALAGWVIVLTGFAVLGAQVVRGFGAGQLDIPDALAGGAMAALATTLGALPLLVMRRIDTGVQGMLLGFGAGVMLAASIFSLLLPGFDAALATGLGRVEAAVLVAAAMGIGAAALLALDRALPHSHEPQPTRGAGAVWLFVFAIAVHNIPEGLAIGVATGAAGAGNAVATGISLQNVPEGLIVALALASASYGRGVSFAVAAVSGLIEPVAALAGAAMVAEAQAVLPWGLAGAAGAMLFVVSHEIIPESHRRGHETLATGGLVGGFALMMVLDAALA